jgi:hypothetical protein
MYVVALWPHSLINVDWVIFFHFNYSDFVPHVCFCNNFIGFGNSQKAGVTSSV